MIVLSLFFTAGEPPAFPFGSGPEDQFVFERDANGNQVSLVITCPVTGSGPPMINWLEDYES